MPTSAEHLMTVGWSTFGCAIGTAAEVVAWSGFRQKSCVLWTISTARSGKLKSQTQEVMVNPIRLLQQDANSEYCIALKSYKEAQKATQQNRDPIGPPEELPPPPVPREYWVEHITVEALIRTINENPRGTLKTYLQLKEEWKLSGGERSDKPFEIEIPTSIGADIIQKAIATSYFYINQAEVLYKGQQQDEDDTVPVIQKLIQKSEELRDTGADPTFSNRVPQLSRTRCRS